MMKKFEATGSLASRQKWSGRPSTAAAVATTVEQTGAVHVGGCCTWECSAREVSNQTGCRTAVSGKHYRITLTFGEDRIIGRYFNPAWPQDRPI
ncbi:hypothetical protein CEXT_85621 [Caerostris extrusa]|uniref:Uncharacterized protein n=1 Tax=Caerostris extrusa TaxID=172846 RepID=A0AAV4Y8Q5_CAEEX|nr:hypothetical protein CEXT_85621 [Caerostris extrusa]